MALTKRKKKQTVAPVIFDEPSLADWLDRHSAKSLWRLASDDKAIEGWAINGRSFIVVLYAKVDGVGGGWDIMTSCDSTDIDHTLEDAAGRLGLGLG